jgi:hypothetical protein
LFKYLQAFKGRFCMNAHEFRDEVLLKAPPSVSRPLLNEVIGTYVAVGQHERRDVAPCIGVAARLSMRGVTAAAGPEHARALAVRPAARPTPEMRLRSAQLARQVRGWVEAVRTALFGHATPPCGSAAEAEAWLAAAVQALYARTGAASRALYQREWDAALTPAPQGRRARTRNTAQRLAVLLAGVRAGIHGSVDAATRAGVQGAALDAVFESPMVTLETEVRHLAEATGFSEADVLADILAGIPPTLPPVTVAVQQVTRPLPGGGGPIARRQVTIVLHARDLTYQEHRALFRQVRQQLQRVRTKGISDEDCRLLRLVERRGPPPSGRGSGAFWTGIRREWNGQGLGKRYASPDGLRMRWTRLQPTLAALDLQPVWGDPAASPRPQPRPTRRRRDRGEPV